MILIKKNNLIGANILIEYEIDINISFEKEMVFTNIFGNNSLLYTIIKNVLINNKKATDKEKIFLLKTKYFSGNFNPLNDFEYIDIKKEINNKFDNFIIRGFREAKFEDGVWYDKNLYKDPPYIKGCKGFNEYITNHSQVNILENFKNDKEFIFFINNHYYNNFNNSSEFYTIVNNDIIYYEDGLLDIISKSLRTEIEIENYNLKNLIKSFFVNFSLDFNNDLKKFIIDVHSIKKTSERDISVSFDDLLKKKLDVYESSFFEYQNHPEGNLNSSKFFFNIPIMDKFNYKNISFNFICNIIPLSPYRSIIVSNKKPNLELEKINLLSFNNLFNLMEQYFYFSKYNKESIDSKNTDYSHLIKNNFLFYQDNVEQKEKVEKIMLDIRNGPNKVTYDMREDIIYIMENNNIDLLQDKVNYYRIKFNEIIENIYKESK